MTAQAKPFSKTADDEDFPVALRLLPASKRRAVLDFYRMARAADDVADDPRLTLDEKSARLAVLATTPLAAPARPHALALIAAFRADAANPPIRTWDDLIASAQGSAVPVGRFLLDAFGEDPAARPAADALCLALQILNHAADCGTDWRELGRVHLPGAWLAEAGVPAEHLSADVASPGLRRVLDRVLDGVEPLLSQAATLPRRLRHPALRIQAAISIGWAHSHRRALRTNDPLAGRVRISPWARAIGALRGVWRGLRS